MVKKSFIKIPRLYEFQFYDNFEEIQALADKIRINQEAFKPVSDEDKQRFRDLASTGFFDWSYKEYLAFIKGIRKHHVTDVEAIAKIVETKTPEEVEEYLRVFLVRFRELKEKDIVLNKLKQQDVEERDL